MVALVDWFGNVAAVYTYDAWGNPLSVTGSLASTVGVWNPLRYRGYVYDTETGLYYLQSRYYNPEIGRFLNADGLISTGQGFLGNNMFAYCGNNPVNRIDPTGTSWIIKIKLIFKILRKICEIIDNIKEANNAPSFDDTKKDSEILCIAQTIYGEAGGRYEYDDWQDGMLAVATVISNRKMHNKYPDDFISVCTEPNQFDGYKSGKTAYENNACDEIMWNYAMSIAWDLVKNGSVMHPSLNSEYIYLHSERYGNQETIKKIKSKPETLIFGGNMFYINYG